MDGSYHAVEFHPSATAKDCVALIRAKLGLRDGALGYAIYEVRTTEHRGLKSYFWHVVKYILILSIFFKRPNA